MKLPTWRKIERKRSIDIRYTDSDFNDYYDIDLDDFTVLVLKLKNKERLSESENDRYGKYILTMCLIVLEGPKFKKKPSYEKEEIIEQQYYELLRGITLFNPDKGSRIFSYAYRIAYTAACHWYTHGAQKAIQDTAIMEHCMEELREYLDAVTDGKVRNINHER